MEGIKEFTYKELRERHRMTDIQIKEAPFCPADFPKDKPKRINRKQLVMLGEFFKINKAFNDAGIKAINLKGPLLSYKLYGDWGARQSKDLDILVDIEEIDKAVAIIENIGYKAQYQIPNTPKKRKLFLKSIHHVVYNHPIKNTQVELHWQMLGIRFCSEKTIQKVIKENTITSNYQGHIFTEFTPELELTYLVMHGTKHAWSRLKWLSDIDKYLETIKLDTLKLYNISKILKSEKSYLITQNILKYYFENSSIEKLTQTYTKTKVSQKSIDYCKYSIQISDQEKCKSNLRYRYSLSKGIYGIYYHTNRIKISISDFDKINLPDRLSSLYHIVRLISWLNLYKK